MRRRFALLALLVVLLAGCASDPPSGQSAGPVETATSAATAPTAAPTTARTRPTRPAPEGVAAPERREAAPDLRVAAFDGRTVTLGGFRGRPVVVNFFESW
jgi:PBP1b-binding outer membrane lipoprotein LpoB